MNEYSDLAKIRFVADSNDSNFHGSNEQEQKEIECVRKEFEDYLFSVYPVPQNVIDKLLPIVNKLINNVPTEYLWLIGHYEGPVPISPYLMPEGK
jgi:ABC-type cobalt transport system substrate-binding protein